MGLGGGEGGSVKYFSNTLRWDMFCFTIVKKYIPTETNKEFIKTIRDVPSAFNNVSTATVYNFKASELTMNKERFLSLYLLNFHLCIVGSLNLFFLIFPFKLIKYNIVNIAVA